VVRGPRSPFAVHVLRQPRAKRSSPRSFGSEYAQEGDESATAVGSSKARMESDVPVDATGHRTSQPTRREIAHYACFSTLIHAHLRRCLSLRCNLVLGN
jgi:hypothetical protein